MTYNYIIKYFVFFVFILTDISALSYQTVVVKAGHSINLTCPGVSELSLISALEWRCQGCNLPPSAYRHLHLLLHHQESSLTELGVLPVVDYTTVKRLPSNWSSTPTTPPSSGTIKTARMTLDSRPWDRVLFMFALVVG